MDSSEQLIKTQQCVLLFYLYVHLASEQTCDWCCTISQVFNKISMEALQRFYFNSCETSDSFICIQQLGFFDDLLFVSNHHDRMRCL